uniref:Uncharacterized protein n=1 Tax=Bactrocera latifrons TaxID=174628 RepID=A0A0K8VYZ1_BACLA
MAAIHKCKALFNEFEAFFKQKMGEIIYRKSIEDTEEENCVEETPKESDVDTDEETHDQVSPKCLKESTNIKSPVTIETQNEKRLPLILIPYVGSPLAHNRRVKRKRLNFDIEESDEEDSSAVDISRKISKKYKAKRLKLDEE